jgi:hypothetical protein
MQMPTEIVERSFWDVVDMENATHELQPMR